MTNKLLIFSLLLASLIPVAFGQDASPGSSPVPENTQKVKPPPGLSLFDSAVYRAEPFIDFALELTKEQYDAILAAHQAHKVNPRVKAARAAESAASGKDKATAKQAKKDAERENDAARRAAINTILTPEMQTLIKQLNDAAKSAQKAGSNEAGLKNLSKEDPQYEEFKKLGQKIEREKLLESISVNLSDAQKAAIEQAKNPQ